MKTQAGKVAVEKLADGTFVVKVKEPAKEGKANQAVIEALAGHFAIPKRSVTILHGHTSRCKLVEIKIRA